MNFVTSFATDYTTAYRLLRQGRADRDLLAKTLDNTTHTWRADRKAFESVRHDVFGRVSAAIYAFKMAKEMRRQKSLVNVLMGIKKEAEARKVGSKNVTLFPITVNRTVIKMQKDPND